MNIYEVFFFFFYTFIHVYSIRHLALNTNLKPFMVHVFEIVNNHLQNLAKHGDDICVELYFLTGALELGFFYFYHKVLSNLVFSE